MGLLAADSLVADRCERTRCHAVFPLGVVCANIEVRAFDSRALVIDNLAELGGSLVIEDSPNLDNIQFSNLTRIAGDLVVQDNAFVLDATFAQLTTVDGRVIVDKNDRLVSVSLPALERVGGAFTAVRNPLLELDDVGALEELGGSLFVLARIIEGFGALRIVGADVWDPFTGNYNNGFGFSPIGESVPSLFLQAEDIDGFNSLQSVPSDITLMAADSVNGFSSLASYSGALDLSFREAELFEAMEVFDGVLVAKGERLELGIRRMDGGARTVDPI